MNKQDILRIKNNLQSIKRILYPLSSDQALSNDQIKLLLKAYNIMVKVASSLQDPYEL